MSVPQHVHDEVRRLLWAVRDGELSSGDAAKLCSMLTDPEARELYVWYSYLCGSLQWDRSARKDEFGAGAPTEGWALQCPVPSSK